MTRGLGSPPFLNGFKFTMDPNTDNTVVEVVHIHAKQVSEVRNR